MPDEVQPPSPVEEAKSLVEQFRSLEQELSAKEGDAPEPAEAKPEPAEAASDEAPKEGDEDDDKGKEGKTLPVERVQFRAEKRAWKAKVAEREAQLAAKEREVAEAAQKLGTFTPEKMKSLRDSGDYDAIAKAVGVESFNELVQEAARAFADPGYKRQKALEAKLAEREKRDEAERQARERQVYEQQVASQRASGVTLFRKELSGWERPEVAVLAAEDDDFAAVIYDRVAAKFGPHDRPSDEEVREEMEAAVDEVLGGVRARFERWRKALGDQATSTPETARAVTPARAGSKQPASASKHVSKSKATEATAPQKELSDAEWRALAMREMRKAYSEDTSVQR